MAKKTARKAAATKPSAPGIRTALEVKRLLRRGIILERANVLLARRLEGQLRRTDQVLLELGGFLMGRAAVVAGAKEQKARIERETREHLAGDRARLESQSEADAALAGRSAK